MGLDHHNLASQSVFEPSFDLTVTNKSTQYRYALKHFLSSDCTSTKGRISVFRVHGKCRDVTQCRDIQHSNS